MKQIYFTTLLLFFLVSCGSGKKEKVDKEVLFGAWHGETYANEYFDLEVTPGENWDSDTTQFQTSFGGIMFESIYRESYDNSYPVNVTLETDKANPFGKPSTMEKVKESIEAYEFLFSANEMSVQPAAKTKIAGKDFVVSQIQLFTEGDTSFVDEYYAYHDGYYLSIVCTYNTKLDEAAAKGFMESIKKLK